LQHEDPVISSDIIANGKRFSQATKLVSELELLNTHLNALLEYLDPPQFLAMEAFAKALRDKYPHAKAWSAIDGLFSSIDKRRFIRIVLTPPNVGWLW